MQSVYPKLRELTALCQSFKGQLINIQVTFQGITIPITNNNIVGDLLEDILFPHFKKAFPEFERGLPQQPPDYFAGDFEFELKAFNSSPGFDISNFTSFVNQIGNEGKLIKKIFKTKYLVFQYKQEGGAFKLLDFWLLNIWQLPNYDLTDPISVQKKKGVWYNIRPGSTKSWNEPQKTPQKFIDNLVKCIHNCNHLEGKDAILTSIVKQCEEAKTLGFL